MIQKGKSNCIDEQETQSAFVLMQMKLIALEVE
jgi:hypothetical protein